MEENRIMIADAAKKVGVEDHVLRYWEKQLGLPISRNEMKQRYFREADVELFIKVKQLKEHGFQLKAIKMILNNLDKPELLDTDIEQLLKVKQNGEEKTMEEAEKLLQESEIVSEAKNERVSEIENEAGTSLIAENESQKVEVEVQQETKLDQFKAVLHHIILDALKENNMELAQGISNTVTTDVIREMKYHMRIQEEKEEERFRKFDATLRDYQKSRAMTAAALERNKKKSKFFQKNKVYI